MMGTGKTSVGRLVASKLELPFLDTDESVVATLGQSIDSLWAARGEAGFRALEREAVVQAARLRGVISTGGGVAADPKNRATMVASGRIVWLRASVETIQSRVKTEQDFRPLLTHGGADTIADLLEQRQGAYETVADLILDTDDRGVEELATTITRWWSE